MGRPPYDSLGAYGEPVREHSWQNQLDLGRMLPSGNESSGRRFLRLEAFRRQGDPQSPATN